MKGGKTFSLRERESEGQVIERKGDSENPIWKHKIVSEMADTGRRKTGKKKGREGRAQLSPNPMPKPNRKYSDSLGIPE